MDLLLLSKKIFQQPIFSSRQGLIWSVSISLILISIFAATHFRPRSVSMHDALVLTNLSERAESGKPIPLESLDVAAAILRKYPRLHYTYDSVLAKSYLINADATPAALYIDATQKRVGKRLHPFYQQFATTTSVIAQGFYEKAYQQSIALESELSSLDTFSYLRGFNLLRLWSLANRIAPEESKHWLTELHHHSSYANLSSFFQEGNISLTNDH